MADVFRGTSFAVWSCANKEQFLIDSIPVGGIHCVMVLLFYSREDSFMEISKADWKLFQDRLRLWQENYMQRRIEEYIKMLQGPETLLLNSGSLKES